MLLKDIPGLLPTLINSVVTESKLWNKEVEFIHPSQLTALRTKTLIDNPLSNIDQEITFIIKHIQFAELDDLCKSPLSDYYRPEDRAITTTEFINGLKQLPQAYRLATIFGLEMGLSAIRTSNLTVKQAHGLDGLTELASSVLHSTLLSTKTIYQFWHSNESNEHVGLDDLNSYILVAFGMSWMQLAKKYKYMVADHYNPLIMTA